MPHSPEDCYGSPLHCHWHGEDEPWEPGFWRACMECGHVYRTLQDLRNAWEQEMPGHFDEYACGFCGHDF